MINQIVRYVKDFHVHFFLLLNAVLFSACETVVDIELPERKPVIVVSSTFSPEGEISVALTSSTSLAELENTPDIVDASVEVSEDGRRVGVMENTGKGVYRLKGLLPKENSMYSVGISAPGYEDVSADDRIPFKVECSLAGIDTNEEKEKINIRLKIKDPPLPGNHYELTLIGKNKSGVIKRLIFTSNDPSLKAERENLDNMEEEEFEYADFSDLVFNGNEHEIKISIDSYLKIKEITASVASISNALYEFHRTFRKQNENSDSPFAEPIDIYSNVRNGAGIFAGYSVYRVVFKL